MEKTILKIFVSAYACEPDLGSEIGVGWHWVLEMSKYFELWVLTRESNRHSIEPWIDAHKEYANIHFLYYDWPDWARSWKKGMRGVRTYYNIWQRCTNKIVKRTMQANDIKIFHHLTYGNVLWDVSSYGKKQFFVWGPVGGVETVPADFSNYYPLKLKVLESVRRGVVSLLPMNLSFRNRCKNADLILCKTEILKNTLPDFVGDKAVLFTDVASETKMEAMAKTSSSDIVNFITVGRLDAWRGFDLAIEAFAQVNKENPKTHLTIVGKGADKERLVQLIGSLNIESAVTLTGKVTMQEYQHLMQETDVVVNASLKEGAVTVSFDSMALGKPLVCIDTTGYTRYFTNDYAVIVNRKDRNTTIAELADGMKLLAQDKQLRISMGEKAKQAAQNFSWEHKGKEIYKTIVEAWNKRTV